MRIYILLFILLPAFASSQKEESGLAKTYEVKEYIPGSYWDFDFTGDCVTDVALLVIERSTNKKGMLDGKTNEHTLSGAGVTFGNGLDDFKDAKRWGIKGNR